MVPSPFRALAQARSLRRKAIPRDGNLPIWPATDSQRFAWIVPSHHKQGCRSMAVSTWLAQRNEKARARLMRNLPEVFPGAVLVHALSRPFLPATPRLASRPLGRPAPKSERYLAQLLRCGLELMDCAERSCPAPESSSEAPLSRNRQTAAQECRGRSPRSPVQGLA